MLKPIILTICFVIIISTLKAQSISYNQLNNVFNTWMQSKGRSITSVNTKLKTISPKWKLISKQPQIDKDSKYYTWMASDANGDSVALAIYIEEDEETTKYSLRYAHHNKALYNTLVTSLKASPYYATGRITTFKNNSKGEYTLNAMASDGLPIGKRIDMIISQYAINVSASNPALYTVDITSRYIPKQ